MENTRVLYLVHHIEPIRSSYSKYINENLPLAQESLAHCHECICLLKTCCPEQEF